MPKSNVSKKVKVAGQRKIGESSNVAPISRLDTLFNDDKYKSDYVAVFGKKNIILPKYIEVQYLKMKDSRFPPC